MCSNISNVDRQTLAVLLFFSTSAMIILLSSSEVVAASAPSPAPAPEVDACASIIGPLTPCLDYLRKIQNKASKSCCDGAKKLSEQATSKEARQATCRCIKQALTPISDVDPSRIPQIPKECGFSATLPPIDRNFNCST